MVRDVTILSLRDKERWITEFREGGLPCHSWEYAWALSASQVDPKLAVVRAGGARMIVPFFERQWGQTTDICTLIGESGASIQPSSAAPLRLWREFATTQGWIAGFIQLSPTVALQRCPVPGELVSTDTVFLLETQNPAMPRSFSSTTRQKIRKAELSGAVLVEDRLVLVDRLKSLYMPMMKRMCAQSAYHFSEETLARWALHPATLALGAHVGDAVEAVSLFLVAGAHAEYHLNARTERGRELSAWLLWNAVGQLRQKGVQTLNLGGGVRRGDGLHQFKSRFNGTETTRLTLRQVYNQQKYDELCRCSGRAHGVEWFPEYRASGD